jgi:glycosyltransferase involved in cell wall biosynthesis
MLISVVICTIRRAELVGGLLACLARQTYRELEVIIVGSLDPTTRREYDAYSDLDGLPLRFITAEKGLSRARNAGLASAQGEIICFLDDDVVFKPEFFDQVVSELQKPEMADIGGLTAYDIVNYAGPVPLRWKLRHLLGITPSLEPGFCTRLGRSVPFSFLKPFSGYKQVGWLPGFCQIFRRPAIGDLKYDEHERIVGGRRGIAIEDRDFSMNVGKKWKLVVVGDLKIEHRRDEEERPPHIPMTWRACYGLGRSFAIRSRSAADRLQAAHIVMGEFLLDVLAALVRPSIQNYKLPWLRANAFVAGYFSAKTRA